MPTCLTWGLSVQFSRSVVSYSLLPHGLQHTRPPCPSSTPGVYSNSCPSSWWCHPTISSSVLLFFSCLQSFPTSGSFPVSQFFTSGGQSIEVSAWASILPMNIQDWFPLGRTGWISLQLVFSITTVQKHQFFGSQLSLKSNSHILAWLLYHTLTTHTFVGKVMSLLFNKLSGLVVAFLSRGSYHCSHHLQWFWRPRKLSLSLFPLFPLFAMKWWDQMPWS